MPRDLFPYSGLSNFSVNILSQKYIYIYCLKNSGEFARTSFFIDKTDFLKNISVWLRLSSKLIVLSELKKQYYEIFELQFFKNYIPFGNLIHKHNLCLNLCEFCSQFLHNEPFGLGRYCRVCLHKIFIWILSNKIQWLKT